MAQPTLDTIPKDVGRNAITSTTDRFGFNFCNARLTFGNCIRSRCILTPAFLLPAYSITACISSFQKKRTRNKNIQTYTYYQNC